MPPRQPYIFDPYTPQSRLLEQYNKPIHSPLQGFAELAGQLGEAYFKKKAEKKEEGELATFAQQLAMMYDQNKTQPAPSPDFQGPMPVMSPDQKMSEAISALSKTNPRLAVQAIPMLQEAAKAGKPPSFTGTLPKGARAFVEGKQVAEGAEDVPEILQPGVLDARVKVAKAGQQITNLNQYSEREENKEYGKSLVSNFNSIRDRATAARDTRNNLQMARSIKELPGGSLEPLKAKVGAFGQALGFKQEQLAQFGMDKATDAQAFTGIMQNLVLTKMQAQKGPQTENDAKRIEKTVASLGNTPEAREFLMRAGLEMSDRDVLQHEFYLDWREKKGSFEGAERAWNKYMANVPMVAQNPKSNLPVFFTEFAENAKKATVEAGLPEPTFDELLSEWRRKYASK